MAVVSLQLDVRIHSSFWQRKFGKSVMLHGFYCKRKESPLNIKHTMSKEKAHRVKRETLKRV